MKEEREMKKEIETKLLQVAGPEVRGQDIICPLCGNLVAIRVLRFGNQRIANLKCSCGLRAESDGKTVASIDPVPIKRDTDWIYMNPWTVIAMPTRKDG